MPLGSAVVGVSVFTEKELAYLRSQPLGRLATVAPDGQPDNAAVGFRVADDGTIVVTGMNLAASRKGRNVPTSWSWDVEGPSMTPQGWRPHRTEHR